MLRRMLVLLAFLGLGACVSQPISYGPKEGDTPEGYSEQKLAENLYRVRFETYREADLEEVEQFALQRAAELTREQGHTEFEVVKKDQGVNSQTEWVPESGTFAGGYTQSLGGVNSAPAQSVPGYTRAFHVRYVDLIVRLLEPSEQQVPQGSPAQ